MNAPGRALSQKALVGISPAFGSGGLARSPTSKRARPRRGTTASALAAARAALSQCPSCSSQPAPSHQRPCVGNAPAGRRRAALLACLVGSSGHRNRTIAFDGDRSPRVGHPDDRFALTPAMVARSLHEKGIAGKPTTLTIPLARNRSRGGVFVSEPHERGPPPYCLYARASRLTSRTSPLSATGSRRSACPLIASTSTTA